MPRAFLITNRRYNSAVDYEENQSSRECSPERRVSTADGPHFEADSDGDSMGFHGPPFKQPTSPHSPAHESRSCQQSPVMASTMYHPLDHTTPPPPQTFVQMTPATPPPPAAASFRTAALVTVIRQLMQTQSPVNHHHHRHQSPPSSSSGPSSPDDSMPDCHVCAECGKRYSTSSNLARHRQTHRSPTDKKARKCPHCDKVYVSMPAFSMHVRTHSQGCMCPYCGKCFSRPWLLQGHVRTHTGEKPFTCPVCRKAFADKSNLRAHVQTHSSSKPYVCRRCGKAFALKSYLYKHEESSCMRVHRQQQESGSAVLDLAITSGDRSNSSSGFSERDTRIRVG